MIARAPAESTYPEATIGKQNYKVKLIFTIGYLRYALSHLKGEILCDCKRKHLLIDCKLIDASVGGGYFIMIEEAGAITRNYIIINTGSKTEQLAYLRCVVVGCLVIE